MTSSDAVLSLAARAVSARRRISRWLPPTPCLASRAILPEGEALYYKAENFQQTGSFKFRGALSKLTATPTDTPLITASSGNHGLALSTAAQMTGHKLTVVLPTTVAREKLTRIEALGVQTILHSDDSGLAERHAQILARDRGWVYVSPYNDLDIIAGQASAGLELLDQLPHIDTVYVAMGGGGLISGIGAMLKAFASPVRVVGVSAMNSAALGTSLRTGRITDVSHSETLADGVAGGMDDDSVTFPLAQELVDDLIDCSEDQIADSLREIAWTEKMLVEGSAALAHAAWRLDTRRSGNTSVIILCGANFDKDRLAPILNA